MTTSQTATETAMNTTPDVTRYTVTYRIHGDVKPGPVVISSQPGAAELEPGTFRMTLDLRHARSQGRADADAIVGIVATNHRDYVERQQVEILEVVAAPEKCRARCGTYTCGRTGEHEEHAVATSIVVGGRKARVLHWGVNGERWTHVDINLV